jgi:phosphatidylinositol alpha-1,6-mannosyltransferase
MVGGIAHYIGQTFSLVAREDLVVISHVEAGVGEVRQDQRFRVVPTGWALMSRGKLAILPLVGRTLAHLFRERDYGVVVAEQVQTAIPAWIASRLIGARLVIFAYGMEITTSRWRGIKGWMFRRADRVITISAYSQMLLERLGVPRTSIGIVPPSVTAKAFNGVLGMSRADAKRSLGIAPDATILVTVAVLKQKYKGIDTAIRAASVLREKYPRLQYFVIGAGPDRPRLEQIASDLRLDGAVRFVGAVDDATKGLYYAASDLFMLPNRVEYSRGGERSEGFGIVFLEAALFGRPAIGGQGGSLDAVLNGVTGLTVTGDSVEEVVSAAARLLDDPQLAGRLGDAGRRRATEEFSTLRVSERLSDLFVVDPNATSIGASEGE